MRVSICNCRRYRRRNDLSWIFLQFWLLYCSIGCDVILIDTIHHHTHGVVLATSSRANGIVPQFWNRQRHDRMGLTTPSISGPTKRQSPQDPQRPEEQEAVDVRSATTIRDRTPHPSAAAAAAATTTTTTILTGLHNWFHCHRSSHLLFLRVALKYAIGCFLFLELCKVIQASVEEINDTYFSQDSDGDDDERSSKNNQPISSSSSRAAYGHFPHLIKEVVRQQIQKAHPQTTLSSEHQLNNRTPPTSSFSIVDENKEIGPSDRSRRTANGTTATASTYQSIYTLAEWLHSAGIPYSRSDDESDGTDSTSLPSVESLLLELTHSEIALLQQCLYVVPTRDVQDNSSETISPVDATSDYIRRNLVGLESIHEQITNVIRNTLGRNDLDTKVNSNATAHNPFASLFQDVDTSVTSTRSNRKNLGILLYGPPGCGKTNLIRTLVQTMQLPCLIITPSILLRKYVGETNLHIRTLFHMVQNKLSPCILCIDELDGLFRERQPDYNEHEVNRELKTEFLQWMDGMMTTTTTSIADRKQRNPIIMIGATNRPFDVDAAIIRRLSHTYYIGLPNDQQRHELLVQFLRPIPNTIIATSNKLSEIVAITAKYTPSDLRQLLQVAAISGPMKRHAAKTTPMRASADDFMLTIHDVLDAMSVIGPTPLSVNYEQQMRQFRSQRNPANIDRFGNSKDGSSLYMEDVGDDHKNNRPFSLAFLDREHPERDDNHHHNNNRWETIFGNFYDIGTLEMDQVTLDLVLEYIRKVLQPSDDGNNNDSHNNDNNHGD